MIQSENKFSMVGILIWVSCALFFTYEFLLRTMLGTFQQPIMAELHLTPFKFAILSTSSFLLIYGLMQLPVGIIIDRLGLKKSLSFAVLTCALSAVLFSYSHQFSSAILIRMIMGLGASFGFICLLIAVYEWMPRKHIGLFIGLSQFIGVLGPMLAAGPLYSLVEKGYPDWRTITLCLGITGLSLTLLVFAVVKNNEGNIGRFKIIQRPTSMLDSLVMFLKQKQAWFIALYSAMIYFTLEYLSENEGKAFLILNGYESKFSSYMVSLGWIGYAIGCPLLGWISDKLKRRKQVMVIAAFVSLFAILGIVYFPISANFVALLFFLLGAGTGGQSIGFAIMAEQCDKSYLAVGLGFNNAMITTISSINAPLIGWLLELISHGQPITLSHYKSAFLTIIALIVGAVMLAMFFVKETYCRPTKGFTLVKN